MLTVVLLDMVCAAAVTCFWWCDVLVLCCALLLHALLPSTCSYLGPVYNYTLLQTWPQQTPAYLSPTTATAEPPSVRLGCVCVRADHSGSRCEVDDGPEYKNVSVDGQQY